MSKLFLKQKRVPIQSLLDMKEDNSRVARASVYNDKIGGQVNPDNRSTEVRVDIKPTLYPDVAHELVQLVNVWDKSLDPNTFTASEYNYLVYSEGDHFTRHRDHIGKKNADGKRVNDVHGRMLSTTTLISKSDDLVGGDLLIWAEDGHCVNVQLEVGETVLFSSFVDHEVTKVIQGTREVLVAWIYNK